LNPSAKLQIYITFADGFKPFTFVETTITYIHDSGRLFRLNLCTSFASNSQIPHVKPHRKVYLGVAKKYLCIFCFTVDLSLLALTLSCGLILLSVGVASAVAVRKCARNRNKQSKGNRQSLTSMRFSSESF